MYAKLQAGRRHEGHADIAFCFGRKKPFHTSCTSDKHHNWCLCREFCKMWRRPEKLDTPSWTPWQQNQLQNSHSKEVIRLWHSMPSHPSKLTGRRFRWTHSCYFSVSALLASHWMIWEPCSYPKSLFDSSFLLLKLQKPALADDIWTKLPSDPTEPKGEVQYVLDGGTLLHWIPWPQRFPTYREFCDVYCQYVMPKYGTAIVIFVGYNRSSTKDMTHQRWTGGKTMTTVTFSDVMKLIMKKDHFLSNVSNKESFINMLSSYIQKLNKFIAKHITHR